MSKCSCYCFLSKVLSFPSCSSRGSPVFLYGNQDSHFLSSHLIIYDNIAEAEYIHARINSPKIFSPLPVFSGEATWRRRGPPTPMIFWSRLRASVFWPAWTPVKNMSDPGNNWPPSSPLNGPHLPLPGTWLCYMNAIGDIVQAAGQKAQRCLCYSLDWSRIFFRPFVLVPTSRSFRWFFIPGKPQIPAPAASSRLAGGWRRRGDKLSALFISICCRTPGTQIPNFAIDN